MFSEHDIAVIEAVEKLLSDEAHALKLAAATGEGSHNDAFAAGLLDGAYNAVGHALIAYDVYVTNKAAQRQAKASTAAEAPAAAVALEPVEPTVLIVVDIESGRPTPLGLYVRTDEDSIEYERPDYSTGWAPEDSVLLVPVPVKS